MSWLRGLFARKTIEDSTDKLVVEFRVYCPSCGHKMQSNGDALQGNTFSCDTASCQYFGKKFQVTGKPYFAIDVAEVA